MMTYNYMICDKAGVQIESAESLAEAFEIVSGYEKSDKEWGEFVPNSYKITVWNEKEERYIPIQ